MMAETVKCPSCGHENRRDARFCQRCGALLETVEKPRPTKPLAPSSPSSDTQPLPERSVGFAPLPTGALLHDGRYLVEEVASADERVNVYLVEDTRSVRLCPNCEAETADPEERFCSFCGADLSGVEPLHLRYRMEENADEGAFAVEAQLLGMGLEHPGLALPHDAFVEAPYGPPRGYLVGPESLPPRASTLTVPQETHRVLAWGASLASALDYAHRNGITLGGAGLEHIAVGKDTARWVDLGVAHIAARGTAARRGQDVQALTRALLYLATGQSDQVAEARLPRRAASAFRRALTAPGNVPVAEFASAMEAALEDVRRPKSVTLAVGQRTDVGQERSLNEDSLLALAVTPVYRSVSAPVGLMIVADGMGGHAAGDVASRLAIQTVTRLAVDEVMAPAAAGDPLPAVGEWLIASVQAANKAVYEQRGAAGNDMGTTLVMALFLGDTATIANVGDSRAYLLGPDRIAQITTDHSLVQRLVATGQITPEEAADHPQKNVIYRVIGDKRQLEVDLFEQQLAPGEALLLCSDGLSGMVSDERMWQVWRTSTSPQETCDRMIEEANRAGGVDNITAVLVEVRR